MSVRHFGGRGSLRIDNNHRPVVASARQEAIVRRFDGVPFEMPGVRFQGVDAPKDHEVRSMTDFTERTCRFPDFLHGENRSRVPLRSGGIHGRSEPIPQADGRPLPGGTAAGEPINQWKTRVAQQTGSMAHGSLQRDVLPVHHPRTRRLRILLSEPVASQMTRALGMHDAIPGHGQLQIIAEARTDCAGDVVDDL